MPEAPLSVLIADDERAARRRLRDCLGSESDMRIVGECADGASAAQAIATLAPQLVFLDIDMPVLNGLQVVARIGPQNMPATVFATAYDHYAVAAFDANAIDYLVKPFERCRFARTLERVRQRLRGEGLLQGRAELASAMQGLAQAPGAVERILVRDGHSQQLVDTTDILYVTAEGNYVKLHTADEQFQLRDTLSRMSERLDPARFRRIHRSHIVNLDHVRRILPWFGGDSLVMMADGTRLTLSRTYRAALAEFR